MSRKKKVGFDTEKMLSSRIELSDYLQFEKIIKYRDGKKLQEIINLFVTEYISGSLFLSGSGFCINQEK